jgi:hypothetical protein
VISLASTTREGSLSIPTSSPLPSSASDSRRALKPPQIAACWREGLQCTPRYVYWFLFLVLIKIYFSSLQVNSDLGLTAFHICSLGQWILVLTWGAIDSCLLLRYFNVNKWPHGGGRGPAQQTQQLKTNPFSPSCHLGTEGVGSKID